MDEFPFSEMEPDIAPAKKTTRTSASIIERSKIQSMLFKHDEFLEYRLWMRYVYQNFQIADNVRVCRITKHSFHNTQIYTLVESSEVVSAGSAASAAGIKIDMKRLALAEESSSNLESVFRAFDNSDIIPQIYISNELLDNDLIIPFSADRSLRIAASDLQERLSWIASIEPSDLVDTSYEAPFSHLQQSQTTNSEFSSMSTAIIGQHIMTTSIAKSVNRLRNASSIGIGKAIAVSDSALATAEIVKTNLKETLERLGHVNEEIFHLRLSEAEGKPWAESCRIRSLAELVNWVGGKIGAPEEERTKALRRIVKMCLEGFNGYERAYNMKVPWLELDPYTRLVRWLVAARRTPELSKHGYSDTANILWDTIQSHKESLPVDDTITSLRRALGARLTFPDSRVAFAALWMLLEPDKHAPKTGSPFEEWTWPQCDLEFDHAGIIKELAGDVFYYEGGETKFSSNSVKDARIQLERRLKLVDAAMNLGFRKLTVYTVKVFIPCLMSSSIKTKDTRQITFLRRKLTDKCDKAIQVDETIGDVNEMSSHRNESRPGEKSAKENEVILQYQTVDYLLKVETLES